MAIIFILSHMFSLSVLSSSDYANAHLPGFFPPLDIPFEYWVEHVTVGLFVSCLDSLLGYSIWEFQALQLIVVFCAVLHVVSTYIKVYCVSNYRLFVNHAMIWIRLLLAAFSIYLIWMTASTTQQHISNYIIQSPWYTGGYFMFLYLFVRRHRRDRRRSLFTR